MAYRNLVRQSRPVRFHLERLESRCLLAADAASMFEIRLETVDANGEPIEQVEVGAEFELRMVGRDLRPTHEAKGLFAAFADIVYRDRLVQPVVSAEGGRTVQFGDDYGTMLRHDLSEPGLINEIGAVAGLHPVGPDDVVIASIRFQAIAAGTSRFGLDAPDLVPMHDVLAYGIDEPITHLTAFQGTSLQVVGRHGEMVPDDGWMPVADPTVGKAGPTTPPAVVPIPPISGSKPSVTPEQPADSFDRQWPTLSDHLRRVVELPESPTWDSIVQVITKLGPGGMELYTYSTFTNQVRVLALPQMGQIAWTTMVDAPRNAGLQINLIGGDPAFSRFSAPQLLASGDRHHEALETLITSRDGVDRAAVKTFEDPSGLESRLSRLEDQMRSYE